MLLLSIKTLFFLNKSRPSLQMKYFNLHYGYIILFFFINSVVYGQTDIIDVTTTGVGISKDEATKNALRNALESSFGAFISSKTEIVNDEIVNDEITSISTGNIVSYEIVSSLVEENNHFVTVNSQVSLVKFSEYIQSRGYNVSFNGKSFVMNMKLQKFNMESEEDVLNDVLEVFFQKFKSGIDFKIKISEDIKIAKIVDGWDANRMVGAIEQKSLEESKQSKIFELRRLGSNFSVKIKNDVEVYKVNTKITCSFNQNSIEAYEYLISSIKSISMKPNELSDFEKVKRDYYSLPFDFLENGEAYGNFIRNNVRNHKQNLNLRSSNSIKKIISVLGKLMELRYNFRVDFGDQTINIKKQKEFNHTAFLIYKNDVLISFYPNLIDLAKRYRRLIPRSSYNLVERYSSWKIQDIDHDFDLYLSEKNLSEIDEFKVVNLN
jgi:hypothetical protein